MASPNQVAPAPTQPMAGQVLRDKKANRTGSRKPLCIGLTLLAIGTILAGVLLPLYFLEITPFDKDGTAPSPPPPIPVASTSASTVKFELIAEGAVTDYTDAKKASIAENVASELGVNVADVTVTVTAASVKITVEVKTDTPDITKAALETKVASPTTASALLGGDVVVTSVANAVFDVPSPPPTAASPPPTGSSVAPGLKTVAGLTTVEATDGSRRQLRNLGRFASARPNPNPSPNPNANPNPKPNPSPSPSPNPNHDPNPDQRRLNTPPTGGEYADTSDQVPSAPCCSCHPSHRPLHPPHPKPRPSHPSTSVPSAPHTAPHTSPSHSPYTCATE